MSDLPRHSDGSPFGTAGDAWTAAEICRAGGGMATLYEAQAQMRADRIAREEPGHSAGRIRREPILPRIQRAAADIARAVPGIIASGLAIWHSAGFDRALRFISGAVLIGLGVFTGLLICAGVTDPEWLAGWL